MVVFLVIGILFFLWAVWQAMDAWAKYEDAKLKEIEKK
jgi:hypothetical protein